MKTVRQSATVASAVQKVNGSAAAILSAAISADKARGKLSDQVRALMASPADIVAATLSAVFDQLESQLKGKDVAEQWARIANSVATNVRTQWNALPETAKPAVCYIALDRGALKANVVILAEVKKQADLLPLAGDTKAHNAAKEKFFGKKKPAASAPAEGPKVVAPNDKHVPKGGTLAAIMEQCLPLSIAELHELAKRIAAEIDQRTAANLEKAEKKGRGASANAKPKAGSAGVAQQRAKNSPGKAEKPASTNYAPVTPTASVSDKKGKAAANPEPAPFCTPTDADAA